MALVPTTLSSALAAAWLSFPPTPASAAQQWASAYDSYASVAQACSGLTPTSVNLSGLESDLETIFTDGGSYSDIAQAMADAHEAYWTGALFGATGTVTVIGGTAALKSGLEALWELQSIVPALFPDSAVLHAALFDTFTKTVLVVDTAVPPPSGCGPAPIF